MRLPLNQTCANCGNCGNLSLCTFPLFPLFPPWPSQPPAPPSSEQRVHLPAPCRPPPFSDVATERRCFADARCPLGENCGNCGNLSLCMFPLFPLFPPWPPQPAASPSSEQRVHLPAPRRPVLVTFHGHLPEPAGLNERIDNCLRALGARRCTLTSFDVDSEGRSGGEGKATAPWSAC